MARHVTVPEDARSKQLRHYHNKRKRDAKYRANRKTDLSRWLRTALKSKRYHAKKQGIPFDLDVEWLQLQPMQCAITGKMFVIPDHGSGPLTPSFDQINPSQGYTKNNTRLVCLWYNYAKGAFPDSDIRALIREAAQVV